MKRIIEILLAAVLALSLAACGGSGIDISQPEHLATFDEPSYLTEDNGAVEESFNVNGRRFNLTLYEFTSKYNAEKQLRGDKDLLKMDNWKKNGQVTKDNKGVKIQYYYYDDENINFTATIEDDSEKLVNIGCGTTVKRFTDKENGKNNSDGILLKAALAAQVVCGYDSSYLNTLQDIFYKTTTGSDTSLYYDGFVFALSTKMDHSDPQKGLMLFRVFPVTEEHREEWKLKDYKDI